MMKKLISVFLSLALVYTAAIVPGAAAQAFPESEHDYKNNTDETWEYVYPDEADGLFVTFSEDTYFAPGSFIDFLTGEEDEETIREVIEYGGYWSTGDLLWIYYNGNELYGVFSAGDLSGETIYIPGNAFSLELVADDADTAYGFSITSISPECPDGLAKVIFNAPDERVVFTVYEGEEIELSYYYRMRQTGDGRMIVGWTDAEGNAYYYDNTADKYWWSEDYTGIYAENGKVYEFFPIFCNIAMEGSEVFSFTNSTYIFNRDLNGYIFTNEHFLHIPLDWGATFTLTPFMPLSAALSAYLMLYWPTMEFMGSCCGFAITALLQHYGKIDMLSHQDVSCVSELEPDEYIQSLINFYNTQALACHITNHMGIEPGTEEYSKQLKDLYNTLEGGMPVYFELYPHNGEHPLKTILVNRSLDVTDAHGILLTGAYTDDKGNHVLIGWDNTSTAYANGTCEALYINEDFTEIYDPYWLDDEPLSGFSWNEDILQFQSFKAEGVPDPVCWHIVFLKNVLSLIKQLMDMFDIFKF